MSNYTPLRVYAVKDALAHLDPLKIILGSDLDGELNAINVAIQTKLESSAIATLAQAQAGAANDKLITPLQLTNWAAVNANLITTLRALAAPGADRLMFYQQSTLSPQFMTIGTGLIIAGTALNLSLGAIDHNSLLNFVANKHIDHSAVSIGTAAGTSGLTGGGDLTATRALAVDIVGLTTDASPVGSTDYVMTYDASATALKKVLIANLIVAQPVAIKVSRAHMSGTQALTGATPAKVNFNTSDFTTLAVGSYSTVTQTYTAGATGKVEVHAVVQVSNMLPGSTGNIEIRKNGTAVAQAGYHRNDASGTNEIMSMPVTDIVDVVATDTITVFAVTSGNSVLAATIQSYVTFKELA